MLRKNNRFLPPGAVRAAMAWRRQLRGTGLLRLIALHPRKPSTSPTTTTAHPFKEEDRGAVAHGVLWTAKICLDPSDDGVGEKRGK